LGGGKKERRLEIMKDSTIGVYGVVAVLFTRLLSW
jgi:cobalamin synthase